VSTIRRALIALVLLGLVVDGALIAYAKGIFSKPPEPKKFDLTIKVEKRDQANKIKKELEEKEGFSDIAIVREKGEKQVLKGYKLVLEGEAETLDPLATSLRMQKHKIKYKKGDTVLTYGTMYPKKPAAEKAAQKLLTTDGVKFLVRENYETKVMSYERMDLKDLTEDRKVAARGILDPLGVEVIEKEVGPGGASPAPEASGPPK
jgi:hypothetical protein